MTSNESTSELRQQVRAWLQANTPPGWRDTMTNVEQEKFVSLQREWFGKLSQAGYATPHWPQGWHGGGRSLAEQKIIFEEVARADAPRLILFFVALYHAACTLFEYGTEQQQDKYLQGILDGKIWCQGFSEPNAGSDLANLQTFAEDKGDHYIVNGQKTWTSGGQWADKCFAIVRTDKSDKHKGISFMLIDMDKPGVEVRPITMISGTSPFCETFFTDVKVPKENLVGEEGQGWTIGKRLLQHERTNISGGGSLARLMGQSLGDIAKKYQPTGADGELADAVLRDKIADFEIRWNSFLLTARRAMEESKAAGGVSEISSVLKKLGTKLSQERSELLIEIRGLQGLGWEGDGFSDGELEAVRAWLFGKATTIYGGSTEIQNNIIAKRVLGMLDHQ